MVTSWNWVYLTDYVCYKPVFLPEDNIAYFSYFFDSSSSHHRPRNFVDLFTAMKRTRCYVAPERWYKSEEFKTPPTGELTPAMDIFSLGCVIAELFLETELFDSSKLLGYLKGTYDPAPSVSK
jgi:phosphoinositide-3-kinase regulatory subunit 4